MAKITDGRVTLDVTMCEWQNGRWTPDMSDDILATDYIGYDEEVEAHLVKSLAAVKDFLKAWEKCESEIDFEIEEKPDRFTDIKFLSYREDLLRRRNDRG